METTIVDVRERDEFANEFIPGSINVPLSTFSANGVNVIRSLSASPLLIMCKSGKRSLLAQIELQKLGVPHAEIFAGGLDEWKKQSKAVNFKKRALPIMQQVQLIAGLLVLLSSLLSYYVEARFVFVGVVVGLGLSIAGSTGFCGLALLLTKAPWNRSA